MPTEFCRHVRPNGTRCNSPALRGQALCYFHKSDRQRYPNRLHRTVDDPTPTIIHPMRLGPDDRQLEPLQAEYPRCPGQLDFPPLEDRASIQIALSMLVAALGRNDIDPKRAGMMLYGLQVASANAKTLTHDCNATVTEIVLDEHGQELAPDEDPEEPLQPMSTLERMLEELAD